MLVNLIGSFHGREIKMQKVNTLPEIVQPIVPDSWPPLFPLRVQCEDFSRMDSLRLYFVHERDLVWLLVPSVYEL